MKNYSIIDIETTGGSPISEKITEIAIYVYNGEKLIDEFVTLINPEKKIPYYITQLTGITNSMVADSPKFFEVAKKIIEITSDTIFVAHNVNFDYGFVKQEFKHLGYDFNREKLCTVKLSRKIIPGHKSYSLGKLCNDLNIELNGRHRAAGDALATVKLFQHLQKENNGNSELDSIHGVAKGDLHPNLNPDDLKKIPEEAGVYYFYNEENELIYIGKSKSLHSRMLSHFRNRTTKKAIEMSEAIASFDYELTGCELVALLKESHEIKQHKPKYNRAQRRAMSSYGLYNYTDSAGYIRFEVAKHASKTTKPICSFSGNKAGNSYMQSLIEKFELCQKLCGQYKTGTKSACFHYEIMECKGACIGKESPKEYNLRAYKVIEMHRFRHNSFFIIEKGKDDNELAVVKIEQGCFVGYGYIDKSEASSNTELLSDCISSFPDNRDIQQILRSYLKKGKPIDIISF